ncbi:MAG: hypothetical protein ACE5GO_11055 [Anaerolineales bacterium]
MLAPVNVKYKLSRVFDDSQATVLAEVIHDAYSDLVRTSDFNELKEIVRSLAISQQRLATAQQRTEARVEELAVAQQRTERALQRLSRQVGGLSDRMGGDLEDVAYIVLHDVLGRELGWQVGELSRTWKHWGRKEEEVDLFGKAHDPDRPDVTIWIVGEVKFNLTINEVKRFVKKVERARKKLEGEVVPICFCYRARPEVQRAVKEAGFRLVFSYGRMV